jgi:polysaccharide export outer membrane protein
MSPFSANSSRAAPGVGRRSSTRATWALCAFAAAVTLGLSYAAPAADAPTGPSPQSVGAWLRDYRLGPGDVVHIVVFNEPNLTGDYSVSEAGDISFPLVGRVQVADATLEGLEQAVVAKLSETLNKPEVTAQIITYRPFYILGEVRAPGRYPYAAGLTVMGAVATAGGFTYRANRGSVAVRHAGASEETPMKANSDVLIRPGDTIRVKERWF